MGYMAHHALIITYRNYVEDQPEKYNFPDIEAYRQSLPEEFRPLLIGPIPTAINSEKTIVFLPDGSKEGWDTSNEGDRIRAELAKMFSWTFDDPTYHDTPYDVVEVRFGGDDKDLAYVKDPRVKGEEELMAEGSKTRFPITHVNAREVEIGYKIRLIGNIYFTVEWKGVDDEVGSVMLAGTTSTGHPHIDHLSECARLDRVEPDDTDRT